MAYTPVSIHLGKLPEYPGEEKKYSLEQIPCDAAEMLVYSFVTTHNEGPFARGYYTLYTKKDSIEFPQYLNVATGAPAVTTNSENMWLPVGNSGELAINLTHPSDVKKSIACKAGVKHPAGSTGEWSDVFIIGYR